MPAGGIPNYAAQPSTQFTPCGQNWFIKLNAPDDCGTIYQNLTRTMTGSWAVNFNIKCHYSYTGSCSIASPTTNTAQVLFTTSSDNYCPRILDSLSSSATLHVYDDTARKNEQSQFVFGTTTYFEARVESSIIIQSLMTEEVSITIGGAVDNSADLHAWSVNNMFTAPPLMPARQIIYSAGFGTDSNLVNTYFAPDSNTCSASIRSGMNVYTSAPLSPGDAITDTGYTTTPCYTKAPLQTPVLGWSITQYAYTPAPGTGPLNVSNFFQWYWNEATSNATGDYAQLMQVQWNGRVRYADQSVAKLSAWLMPAHLNLLATGATTARVTSPMTAPRGSPASVEAVSTTTVAVAAAALVLAAAVGLMAAIYIARDRDRKAKAGDGTLENISLQLRRGSSSATLS
jgi:hypothetical protein